MKKSLPALFFTLLIVSISLPGCEDIFTTAGTTLIGASQQRHEYYLHYIIDFDIGGHAVLIDRYGKVISYYQNFAGNTCDRSRPECWLQISSFFVTLPNGDIVGITNVDKTFDYSLSTFKLNETRDVILKVTNIYRDQIISVGATKGQTSCWPLNNSALLKDYGLAPIKLADSFNTYLMPVKAKVERADEIPDDQQKYVDWQSKAWIDFNKALYKPLSCKSIIANPYLAK